MRCLDADQYIHAIDNPGIFSRVEQHSPDMLDHINHCMQKKGVLIKKTKRTKTNTLRSLVFNRFPSNDKPEQVEAQVDKPL